MQQAIVSNSYIEFNRELNAVFMDGWKVVPGTFYINSVAIAPARHTRPEFILPDGTTRKFVYAVAVDDGEPTGSGSNGVA